MGYRHYFYKVNKEDVKTVKELSLDELKEKYGNKEYGYVDLYDLINQEQIFEFGKLYFEDTAEQIYDTGNPLFDNAEVMEYFSDYVPFIVGKDGVLKAIEIYKNKIKKYYKDMLVDEKEKVISIFGLTIKDEDIKSIDKVKKEVQDKIRIWEHYKSVVDIDENNKNVTKSCLYEYSIFNLVFILKTFNWEKETILFYGW